MPDTLPLSPAAQAALITRLTRDIGHKRAVVEVARAVVGHPSARAQDAMAALWAELEPAVAAVGAGWAATATEETP